MVSNSTSKNKFLNLEFYIELNFLKLNILVCIIFQTHCGTYYILYPHSAGQQNSLNFEGKVTFTTRLPYRLQVVSLLSPLRPCAIFLRVETQSNTQIWEKEKRNEWEQNKRSVLRRVVSSDPSRKHWRHRYSPSRQRHLQSPPLRLCWPLYIYPSLSLSSNSHYSNSTPHFSLFFQMTPSAIPRSSETLTAPSSSAASLATPPKTLFTRSLLFSTLALSVWLLRKLKGK